MRPSLLLIIKNKGIMKMKKPVGIILASALLSLHGCSTSSVKQENIQPPGALSKATTMVARVNGQPITEAAIKNLTIETAMYNRRLQVPREKLIKELIDRELLYQEALAQDFDKTPAVADQITVASRAIVSKAYMRTLVNKTNVSRKEVQAEYQRRKDNTDLRQFRISHILVEKEKEATQLIAQLTKGKDFQALAKQFSKDSTSIKGGVLGWRGAKQMEPEISIAVKQLKVGGFTAKPVKTTYGWHIVLLDEVREQEAPAFDKQAHSLESILKRKKLKEYIQNLEAKSSIEFFKQKPAPIQPKKAMTTDHTGHQH
jgi:peptidyl-prolyl cis-trans isomerase C